MKDKIVIFGDDHVRYDEPFYSAKKDYFSWVIEQDFNNESNIGVHVGDVFHSSHPTPNEYNLVFWYLQNLKFNKMYILAGNGIHEYNRSKEMYAIEPLSKVNNVEIITQPQESKIGNLSILFLPWVPSRYYNDKTMKEWYENYSNINFDYVFGHFAHKEFFGTEIDISHIKGNKRMGHIHIPDGSGEYVGVNIITRADEKGIDCKLNIIDIMNGSEEIIDIPKFIDYYEVDYPNDLPEVEAKYSLWTIKNAPNKEKAEHKYSKNYIKEVVLEKNTLDKENNTNIIEEKQSISEYLTSFINDYKIKKGVEKKLRSVL